MLWRGIGHGGTFPYTLAISHQSLSTSAGPVQAQVAGRQAKKFFFNSCYVEGGKSRNCSVRHKTFFVCPLYTNGWFFRLACYLYLIFRTDHFVLQCPFSWCWRFPSLIFNNYLGTQQFPHFQEWSSPVPKLNVFIKSSWPEVKKESEGKLTSARAYNLVCSMVGNVDDCLPDFLSIFFCRTFFGFLF